MNKHIEYLEIFPWNESFDTGLTEIDNQHKKLVELLNQLSSHLAYQFKSPTMDEIFNELTAYAVLHFNTEETIWQQYFIDDDWYNAHKVTHANFINDVLAIKANANDASYNEVIEKIVLFLSHWLAFHIIETDKNMAKVVLAMQHGCSLPEAKNQVSENFDSAIKALIKSVLVMYQNTSGKTLELIREINERKKLEDKLRKLANTDPLTELFNRRVFLEKLDEEIAKVTRLPHYSVALLMLDLDFFKRINDTYDHSTGDDILKAFAEIARTNSRIIDVPARLGGEEFAILLIGTNKNEALVMAERLRKQVAGIVIEHKLGLVRITVSIGATCILANDNAKAVLHRADTALYEAKDKGRNQTCWFVTDLN